MKILVLGAGGQLGKEFQYLSEEVGYPFTFFFKIKEQLNILDKQQVKQVIQELSPNILINCAAYTAVDKAESEPDLAYTLNAEAPAWIAEMCTKYNCRMIHFSSDYVYHNYKNIPLCEEDLTQPVGVYAKSKLQGEKNILRIHPDALIFRTSWIYSMFGKNFVRTILRLSTEKKSISVVNDQIGAPTWARDIASMVLTVLQQNSPENITEGIYNYSNSGVASWYDFASMICRLADLDLKITPIPSSSYPTPAVRPFYSVLSHQKITNQYNPQLPHWVDSLESCLQELL